MAVSVDYLVEAKLLSGVNVCSYAAQHYPDVHDKLLCLNRVNLLSI